MIASAETAANATNRLRETLRFMITLRPRRQSLCHFPRLRGQPDRRIDGAEALVGAALDDLKKEQILEGAGVGLEIFAGLVAVVEDVVAAQDLDPLGAEIGPRLEIVV